VAGRDRILPIGAALLPAENASGGSIVVVACCVVSMGHPLPC